nr:hypothetical protein [uncultured Shewanella sp.]
MQYPIAAQSCAIAADKRATTEAQLLMHLGIACRLAQLNNLMHCPTVIQRKNALEQYLQNNICTYAFRERFHVTKLDESPLKTTPLNEVANIQITRSGRVKLTRVALPIATEITVSDRTCSWINRCFQQQVINSLKQVPHV